MPCIMMGEYYINTGVTVKNGIFQFTSASRRAAFETSIRQMVAPFCIFYTWETTPQTECGTDRQNARHFDDKRKREPARRTNANPTDNRYAAPIIGRGRSSKILAAKKSTSTTKGTTVNRQVGLFMTRLATKTRAADVAAHVSLVTGLTVKCEAIKTKYDGYRSVVLC